MKKFMVILFMIILSVDSFALLIESEFKLDIAYIFYYSDAYVQRATENNGREIIQNEYAPSLRVTLEDYIWLNRTLFIGGSISTMVANVPSVNGSVSLNFNPYYVEYVFSIGVDLKDVIFYYEHVCKHTMSVHAIRRELITTYDGAMDMVGLCIKRRF